MRPKRSGDKVQFSLTETIVMDTQSNLHDGLYVEKLCITKSFENVPLLSNASEKLL